MEFVESSIRIYETANIKEKIQILAGQLFYLDSLMKTLDGEYKKYLSKHPE